MKTHLTVLFLMLLCAIVTNAQKIDYSILKEKSIDSLEIYLQESVKNKDELTQAYCYKFLAEKNTTNRFLSVEYSLKAIKLFKNTNPEQENWQKLFLANSFSETTDGLPAISYAMELSKEALAYSQKNQNSFMLMSVYQVIIRLLSQSDDSAGMIKLYLDKCQDLIAKGQITDPVQLMVFDFQKGKLNSSLKKFDAAIHDFEKSAITAQQTNSKEFWTTCQLFIAQNLRFINKNQDALRVLNEIVADTLIEENLPLSKWKYQEMALVFTNLNRLEEANKTWEMYFQKQVEIDQSLPSTYPLSDAISFQLIENQKNENEMISLKNKNYQKAIAILAILVIGALTLMFLRFKFQRLKLETQKNEILMEGQEMERNRLGSKLHDVVGSSLATIKNNLSLQKNLENPEFLIALVDDAYLNVRDISHQMYPKYLKDNGLELTLRDYFNLLNPKDLVSFKFFGTRQKLPQTYEIHIFRIIQELTINALKHAKATKIEVELSVNDHEITITVNDNGIGFNEDQIHDGIGLINIKNRVYLLNGRISFLKNKPQGSHISVILPPA